MHQTFSHFFDICIFCSDYSLITAESIYWLYKGSLIGQSNDFLHSFLRSYRVIFQISPLLGLSFYDSKGPTLGGEDGGYKVITYNS
jgi:hypothetical protein